MKPFDFEYVLFCHSGTKGWRLTEGDPENFTMGTAVSYVHDADPNFPQTATFVMDYQQQVSMTLNDRLMIVSVELPYMKFQYCGGDDDAY